MEKKNVQRIIGIVVIIALVVIIMPVLFGRNDLSTQEASNLKAPPFTDEQKTLASTAPSVPTPVSTSDNSQPPQPDLPTTGSILEPVPTNVTDNTSHDVSSLPSQPATMPTETSSTPSVAQATSDSNTENATDAKTMLPSDASDEVKTTSLDKPVASVEQETTDKTQNSLEKIASSVKKEVTPSRPNKTIKTAKITSHKKSLHQANKLTSPTWAIQMGSFKVKQNAIQLTNKLRTAGYRVFVREFKSASGHVSTRVYIGPEYQHASAIKLANEVQTNLKLPGIVITCKSLEL